MGYKKKDNSLGSADLDWQASSLKHNRSLKLMKKLGAPGD